MSKKVQEQFRDNIPAALRNNDLILNYAEAIGEVFDEIRQDINYKAYETDYAKSRFHTFDDVTANIGLRLSPFLKEQVTRRIVRDMPNIYTRLGTRGSLEWALKTLGYRSFQIDEVWVPNPDLVRKGYYRGLFSHDEPRRYDIKPQSYTDFVVGEEYVTDQGTFFKGHSYIDFEKNDTISGVPIYGEGYSTYTGLTFKDMVSKTPYIIVRLYDTPLYDEVITDIDPTTGVSIELTVQEKQKVVSDMIRYLIQNLQRTATTSIILVTGLFVFDDMIKRIEDPVDFSHTHTPFVYSDYITQVDDTIDTTGTHKPLPTSDDIDKLIDGFIVTPKKIQNLNTADGFKMREEMSKDGKIRLLTTTFDILKVGNKRNIGQENPYPSTGEYLPAPRVGTNDPIDRDIVDGIRTRAVETNVVKPPLGYEHVVFVDYGARVLFNAPTGVDVVVETARNYHESSSRTLIGTVVGGTTFSDLFTDTHAVILRFLSDSSEITSVNVSYDVDFLLLRVGNKRIIGQTHAYLGLGEYIPEGSIGVIKAGEGEALANTHSVVSTTTAVKPPLGYEHVVFLDQNATVAFTAPIGVSVDIETMKDYHTYAVKKAITTVSGGSTFSQTIAGEHVVILRFNASSSVNTQVSVTY